MKNFLNILNKKMIFYKDELENLKNAGDEILYFCTLLYEDKQFKVTKKEKAKLLKKANRIRKIQSTLSDLIKN